MPRQSVRVRQTQPEDIPELIRLQKRVYPFIPSWTPKKFTEQMEVFPQGQLVAESDNGLVGGASSLMVDWDEWAESHTWKEITSAGRFHHHNPGGRTLYGAEVFVDPTLQRSGIGHELYEARRALCRAMNLKRIIACGRLPGYHRHAGLISAEFYAQKVVWGDFKDQVLSFQLREGFSYCGVIEGYLPEDRESAGYASIIVWLNPDYDPKQPPRSPQEVFQ